MVKGMKICMVSLVGIYPERSIGPTVNAYNLAKNFRDLGEECHVIVGSKSPQTIKKALDNECLDVYPLMKDWAVDWGRYKSHNVARRYLSNPLTPLELALRIPVISQKVHTIITSLNPDILFYNLVPIDPLMPLPFFYHLRKKVQVVRMPAWFPIELKEFSKNRVNTFAGTRIYKKILKQFKVIVTHSTAMQQIITKEIGNSPSCVVIPNGVDLEKFTRKVNHGSNRNRILFVGKLSREKGVEDLIRALSLLPLNILSKIGVWIVGGGSPEYISYLYDLAGRTKVKDRITFLGEIDWDEIPLVYKSSDVFVLPSYREGFPHVLLEAMASGVAIIATNVSGVQDIIKSDNGLLFECGDVKKLAQYIAALVNDDDIRRKMSEKAYCTALDFSWRNIARRYLNLFSDLLDNE